MAYNTFPQYGYPYYQPIQQAQPQNAPQNTGIVWVQGEAGAKSYLIAPNTTVALWDSETQTIYLKTADASGMPSMKILDYSVRDTNAQPKQAAPEINLDDYITRKDFEAFEEKIKKQIKKLSIRSAEDDE